MNAKQVAQYLRPHVDVLLLATAFAKLEHDRIETIQRRVLSEGVYTARRQATYKYKPNGL